jgi:MYXO-CTERM domain-containing protein
VITDHRMVFSVSPQQTTLYDQIRYTGNPSSFAWVLPIAGSATVGISSDTVFRVLDSMTAVTVQAPPQNCPGLPASCQQNGFLSAPSAGGASNAAGDDGGGVQVTKDETVGPYEAVQLHSTDANGAALIDWLTQHGFVIPDDTKPIIAEYVAEHFDFLALKLVPGQGIQAMRPIRVTTQGATAVLPLRMVAAGTGATVGITLWVVAEGRYSTQNFPGFQITADQLVWDWTTESSNYKELRAQQEAVNPGRAWETESSVDLSINTIEQAVRNGGCGYYGPNYGGGGFGGGGAAYACVNPSDDYAPPDAGGLFDAGPTDAGPLDAASDGGLSLYGNKTNDQLREQDLATLFAGIVGSSGSARITRLRSDVTHSALTVDLVLQASGDQSELSPLRQVTREANQPQCPIYQGCQVVGQGPRDQAIAAQNQGGSESFNCSTAGSNAADGTVVAIGALAGLLGLAGIRMRRRPRQQS